MTPRQRTTAWPQSGRIMLVLLAAIPAAMAYPWPSTRDRWVLGVAVALTMVLLGRWRGLYLTTMLRRGAAMLRHRRGVRADPPDASALRSTALLRVVPSVDSGRLPLTLIAAYLNRYGLRADVVRITSRDVRSGRDTAQRDTWIGLTLSAADNLAALRGRSRQIPLRETTEVALRRLADQLRETGWETSTASVDDVPALFGGQAREGWRALSDGSGDYLAAYRLRVDDRLSDTFAAIWAADASEIWTVVEIAGTAERRTVAAGCALRTDDRAPAAGPLPGLDAEHGNHRAALQALHPLSGRRLPGHTDAPEPVIAQLRWPTSAAQTAQPRARSHGRHAVSRT